MRYEVMLRANAVFAIEVEADDEDRAASLAEAELANAMSKGNPVASGNHDIASRWGFFESVSVKKIGG